MKIDVGEYRLAQNEMGWCVKKKYVIGKGKNKGKVKWREPKYYHKLHLALEHLYERILRDSDSQYGIESVGSIRDEVVKARAQVISVAKEIGELI